jgi:penicillin-binding protein 1A
VEAAAENYFGKKASELNLAECAILAGLPQAPSRYSPFRHPDKAKERQAYVLKRMVVDGYISQKEATDAINTVLDIKPRRNLNIEEVPAYTEVVRRHVEAKYGADTLYNQGLQIYTAVNVDMQKTARDAVQKGLAVLDKRQGYRGPLQHLAPGAIDVFCQNLAQKPENGPLVQDSVVSGVVIEVNNKAGRATIRMGAGRGVLDSDDMRWALAGRRIGQVLKVGDVILIRLKAQGKAGLWALSLEQVPKVQGALLCIAPGTGQVKAMVGGRDFRDSQFNRAIQSRRQPGSAFKPVIYAAAIDKGYTPASVIIDSPIVFEDAQQDKVWKPKNYEEKFLGPTLLRDALAHSRNVITIKILQSIGTDYVVGYARKLGITSTLEKNLSLALGSSGVSLLELTEAYSVFNNLGDRIKPVFITKIVDRSGKVLEQAAPTEESVISKATAYIMTSLLQSVIEEGTGRRVLSLNRPAAGKTGTTNDFHDAWFIGYTPQYTTGVWVGFDNEASLGRGETGARAASPIWLDFMQQVLAGKPAQVFQIPKGVVFAKIDADTGLLPIPESKHTIFECFKEGTVPTEYTPKPDAVVRPDQFFKSNM